jgi:hypothetical protein
MANVAPRGLPTCIAPVADITNPVQPLKLNTDRFPAGDQQILALDTGKPNRDTESTFATTNPLNNHFFNSKIASISPCYAGLFLFINIVYA